MPQPPNLVPITEDELGELIDRLPLGEVLPLSWGVDGAAIVATGDGLALWALRALLALRHEYPDGG
jgi:hypothetical protein